MADDVLVNGADAALREAIRTGSLEAAAQPIFHLESGTVVTVELLARLTLSDGHPLPPSDFIPMAEQLGLIRGLTDVMLGHAARLIRAWDDHPELSRVAVGVNVSPMDLADDSLVERVRRIITEGDIPRGRLGLELTETSQLPDVEDAARQFEQLRELGVGLAIDDFGTGYFSPAQLLTLPVAGLKLDREFVIPRRDERERRFIEALLEAGRQAVMLGHFAAKGICAEAIETTEELAVAQALGIRFGQGELLQPPVPADELAAILSAADGVRPWLHRPADRSDPAD